MKLFEGYLKTFDSDTTMEGSVLIFRNRTEEEKSVQEPHRDIGKHVYVSDSGYCYEKDV